MLATRITAPTSICRFGIARSDITPPVGIYHRMWGAALHDRSEGIHRPLTATAMTFQPAAERTSESDLQVVIAVDHCLLGRAEMDQVLEAIQRRCSIPRECLIVIFSHTHGAGLMSLDRVSLPGGDLIPPYLEQLAETIGSLVEQALKSAAEATITYGRGRCDLARHRDFWDTNSRQWVCGLNPQGTSDDTVVVARVTTSNGQPLATIVNYACHPTTLAWDNRLITPDFPGAMRETIEQVIPAPCVFIQGASGDLGPKFGYVGDVEVADRNGRQLAYAALSALSELGPPRTTFRYTGPVVSGATLGVWEYAPMDQGEHEAASEWKTSRQSLPLAYRPGLPTLAEVQRLWSEWSDKEQAARRAGDSVGERDARAMLERQTRMITRLQQLPEGNTYPFQLFVWRMGNAIWVAAQGESYSLLQTSLRRRFPDVAIVVCSIANGWGPSYLPPAELYDLGIYQESIAMLAPGCLERLIAEAECRIADLISG